MFHSTENKLLNDCLFGTECSDRFEMVLASLCLVHASTPQTLTMDRGIKNKLADIDEILAKSQRLTTHNGFTGSSPSGSRNVSRGVSKRRTASQSLIYFKRIFGCIITGC